MRYIAFNPYELEKMESEYQHDKRAGRGIGLPGSPPAEPPWLGALAGKKRGLFQGDLAQRLPRSAIDHALLDRAFQNQTECESAKWQRQETEVHVFTHIAYQFPSRVQIVVPSIKQEGRRQQNLIQRRQAQNKSKNSSEKRVRGLTSNRRFQCGPSFSRRLQIGRAHV